MDRNPVWEYLSLPIPGHGIWSFAGCGRLMFIGKIQTTLVPKLALILSLTREEFKISI